MALSRYVLMDILIYLFYGTYFKLIIIYLLLL